MLHELKKSKIKISNVQYIPALHLRLISCSRIDKNGKTTNVCKQYSTIFRHDDNNNLLCCNRRRESNGLYFVPIKFLNTNQVGEMQSALRKRKTKRKPYHTKERMWCTRMGHASHNVVRNMIISHEHATKGKGKLDIVKCHTCTHIKQTNVPACGKLVPNSLEVTIH